MKILGIDPGSRVTGFGIVEKLEGGRLIHVCDGTVRPNARAPLSERLFDISEGLKDIIGRHRPDAVAVEAVFVGKNIRSAIMLGHARGAVLVSAASSGLSVHEYSPTTVKQSVVGYGRATKEQVKKMVGVLLKVDRISSTDAADALAAAICHIHHCGPLTRARAGAG